MLVIGVGNLYRSDDGAGLAVIGILREMGLDSAQLIECDGDSATLLDAWQNASAVILIDAVSSGATPGMIYRFDLLAQSLPHELSFRSTHAFGVAEALDLGHALRQLPARLILYAIEGKTFAAGIGLSGEVEHSVQEVAQRVKRDLITKKGESYA